MTSPLLTLLMIGVAAALSLLLLALRRRRSVVIGERGVFTTDLGCGWIPWEEIEGVYPPSVEDADSLRVRVRVTERLCSLLRTHRPPTACRVNGMLEIRLDLAQSPLTPGEVLLEILSRQPWERPTVQTRPLGP
jgi:hypothetical protein